MQFKIISTNAMPMKLSMETQEMLKQGCGYRNDDKSEWSAGHATPLEIISQEMLDLDNKDIPKTMHRLHSTSLNATPEQINNWLIGRLGKNYHLLWLCSKPQFVNAEYADNPDNTYKVTVPSDVIVVSDIYDEGALLASKENLLDL